MFTLNLSVYENILAALVILLGVGFVTVILSWLNLLFSDDYEKIRLCKLCFTAVMVCFTLGIGCFITRECKANYVSDQFETEFEENVRNIYFKKDEVTVETDDNIYVFTHVAGSNYEVEKKEK